MTGALGFKTWSINGEILLNLDTEEDDEIDIGCAGGIDVTASANYTLTSTSSNFVKLKSKVYKAVTLEWIFIKVLVTLM